MTLYSSTAERKSRTSIVTKGNKFCLKHNALSEVRVLGQVFQSLLITTKPASTVISDQKLSVASSSGQSGLVLHVIVIQTTSPCGRLIFHSNFYILILCNIIIIVILVQLAVKGGGGGEGAHSLFTN